MPVSNSAVITPSDRFHYTPPIAAQQAKRILVKPNLGYPVGPPATVSIAVLGEVIRSLRESSPQAEILIVEGVCSKVDFDIVMAKLGVQQLLSAKTQLLNADELELAEYPNHSPSPVRFKTMWAPKLLQEVDCCISVSAFKRTQLKGLPLISATLKNLYGLFPRATYKARSANSRGQLHRPSVPLVLQDVYYTLGHFFAGGVVDCTQKFISRDWQPDRGDGVPVGQVIYGDDLISVDRIACQVGQEDIPDYITTLENQRQG